MANVKSGQVFFVNSQDNSVFRTTPSKRDVYKYAWEMQSMVGSHLPIKVDDFRNWSGTQERKRVIAVAPTTVEDVQAVIIAARRLGLGIRAAGQKHSWSPLFTDEGQVVLYTSQLRRPNGRPQMEITHDIDEPWGHFATVAASATSGDFMNFQLDNNICIPSNVVIRVVQMGGVVSTGSHGVASDAGAVGDDIVSMRIINSDGQLVEYSMKTDPEMMKAVQCSLGMFGIIVDFTIKVTPMVFVETQNIWLSVKDLFHNPQNLCNIVYGNWSVEMLWFPFNSITSREAAEAVWDRTVDTRDWDPLQDDVLVRIVNKVQGQHQPQPDQLYRSQQNKVWVQTKALQAIDGFVSSFPITGPTFDKVMVSSLKSYLPAKIIQRLPHAVHFREYTEGMHVQDMEWCFDMGRSCSNLSLAVRGVIDLVQKEAIAGRFPLNLPLDIRITGQSQSFLSPMGCASPQHGGSGNSCYIEVLSVLGTPHWTQFCQNVAYLWGQLPGARPHWGKEWAFLSRIDEHLRRSYARHIPLFLAALKRSGADPDGTFLNNYLEKLFYPRGFPGGRKVVLLKGDYNETCCQIL